MKSFDDILADNTRRMIRYQLHPEWLMHQTPNDFNTIAINVQAIMSTIITEMDCREYTDGRIIFSFKINWGERYYSYSTSIDEIEKFKQVREKAANILGYEKAEWDASRPMLMINSDPRTEELVDNNHGEMDYGEEMPDDGPEEEMMYDGGADELGVI